MFTSANSYPIKVLRNPPIKNGKYFPVCVQLWLTNRCNLKCPYCATQARNISDELSYSDIKEIAKIISALGTKAVVLSGGGEAILHPYIDEIINLVVASGIKVGLITNGILLKKLRSLNSLEWCRISFDDYRIFAEEKYIFEPIIMQHQHVDWAFSYLITDNFNQANFQAVLDFVLKHDSITHCRITSDVFNPVEYDKIPNLNSLPKCVIREPNTNVSSGNNPCYMSIAKPLIAANGNVYGCCEVLQYLGFNASTKNRALF